MNDVQPKKLPKPTVFDQLYPGRFIKAAELLGKKPTLTIADYDMEELQGEQGMQVKAILSFLETPKKMVLCKTNGICLREMFGKQLDNWVDKRIVLFEGNWNGEAALRIWGSPDIEKELQISVQLPRRKPIAMTMRKTEPPKRREPGQEG